MWQNIGSLQQFMNYRPAKGILVALLIALVSATVIQTPTTVVNKTNCYIISSNNSCQQCSFGYTLQKMNCVKGQQNCKTFNPTNGICTSCYVGSKLMANSSCQVDPKASLLKGCSHLVKNVCLACSSGYYFNIEGNCQTIDANCKYFNYAAKRCATCYPGYAYIMNQGKCVKQTYKGDSNCTLWKNNTCQTCDNEYYFDNSGYCVLSNPTCLLLNQSKLTQCLGCNPGYTLVDNTCVVSSPRSNDVLCAKYDSKNVCTSCLYQTTVLNAFKICVPVNPLCLTFDTNGNCLSCYTGYQLNNKACVTSQQLAKNPLCFLWSSDNCLVCGTWSYFDSRNICQPVDTQCRTYNSSSGQCTSCYKGWKLNKGVCSYYSSADPNCKTFNLKEVCTACFPGYFYNQANARCQLVNKLCNGSDTKGNCLKCFKGFTLRYGQCVVLTSNCYAYDENGSCSVCEKGYHVTSIYACVLNRQNCQTYNSTQQLCSRCENNYKLVAGACYPIVTPNNTKSNKTKVDPLCSTWSADHTACYSCSYRACFNSSGYCQKISDYCVTYDTETGQCLTCYKGYKVSGRTCVLSSNTSTTTNSSTTTNNSNNNINSSNNCKTSDSKGSCLTCYDGWSVLGKACVVTASNCKTQDKDGRCTSCYENYYLSSGTCKQVDQNCKTFNYKTSLCSQCYSGFKVVNNCCQAQT